jgi:hypothetical protein
MAKEGSSPCFHLRVSNRRSVDRLGQGVGPQTAARRPRVDDHIRALLLDDEGGPVPTEDEIIRCPECLADFIADSDSGERVILLNDDGAELFEFPSRTHGHGTVSAHQRLGPAEDRR